MGLLPLLADAANLRNLPVAEASGKHVKFSTAFQKAAYYGCKEACKSDNAGAESACVTSCEAAYYQCNDVACQEKVLAEYEKTKGIEKKEEKKEEKKAEKGGKEEAKKEEKKEEKRRRRKLRLLSSLLSLCSCPKS